MTERWRTPAAARAAAPPPASDATEKYRALMKELQSGSGLKEVSLRDCELHRTNVRELGDALFLHPTLTSLSFHGCRIGDAAVFLITALLRSHPSLTFADFSNNNISKSGAQEIITALEANVNVTHLDISTDTLEGSGGLLLRFATSSPPTQEQLARVRTLCDANTELRTTLREARPRAALKRRNLAVVPAAVLEWANLVSLDLSNNRFSSIPATIVSLQQLEVLNLSSNSLTSLPTEMCKMTALKRLELEANSLTSLPESLVLLPSLTTLNVTKNRITAVPRFVGAMSKLSTFRSAGNPFMRLLPRTITSSDEVWGVMAVLDYLRSLALKGEAKQDRIRVMIVGRENVGKTSLCVALTNLLAGRKTVRLNSSASSKLARAPVATDGVDIHTLQDAEQHVSFSLWDLAGQELYQVTHTLFLNSQSVYVIAVNMTAPDDIANIEYWLELLQARAGTPPVLFVGTHAELLNSSAVENFRKFHTRYTLRFPFCRASYPVSCVSGYGLRDFKNGCVAIAREMNWIGGLIPASYVALASHLDGLRQNSRVPTLPLARYKEIAEHLGINADGLGAATKYLVNTGHALYFGELNPALRDTLFLDAQWLPKVFATIITMKQTFHQAGMLSRVAMRQIWQAPAFPPDTHDQIISLFEEFDFFYRLPDSDLIVVPSLLPAAAPPAEQLDKVWPPGDVASQVSRIVELGFVPRGFIGRLLVSLLKAGWRMVLCWRTGWVIELGGTKLRGEMVDVTRSLWLHARGERSRTEILHLLDAIEQNLTQMHHATYKYRVPCLHCIAAGRTAPNQMSVFALEDIEDVTSIGLSVIACTVDKEEVPIALLAPDVAMSGIPRLADTDIGALEYVASGSFADVYRSTFQGAAVAVKQLLIDDEETANFGELRREALLMHQLRHANLVSLVGVMMNPPAIVMEYMHLGDLFNYLHSDEPVSWSLRHHLAHDIARGLAFLHAQNPQIVHRDVKSPNVLLTVCQRAITAKVADIGSARPLGVLNSSFRTRAVDNPTWLAPEAMSLGRYGAPADVYALGVICWELAARATFFGSCQFMWEIEDHVMAGHRPDLPHDAPEAFAALIRRCWAQNPEERPTAAEAVALLAAAIEREGHGTRELLSEAEHSLIDSGSKVVRAKPPVPQSAVSPTTPRAPLLRIGKTVAMLDESAEVELLTQRAMPTSRRVYERSTNTGEMLRELRHRLVADRDSRRGMSEAVLSTSHRKRAAQERALADSRNPLADSRSSNSLSESTSSLADSGKNLSMRNRLQRTPARKELPRVLSPSFLVAAAAPPSAALASMISPRAARAPTVTAGAALTVTTPGGRPRALSHEDGAVQKVLLRSTGTRDLASEAASDPAAPLPAPRLTPGATHHTVKLKLPLATFDETGAPSGPRPLPAPPLRQPLPSPPPVQLVESESFRATRQMISEATAMYRKDEIAKRSRSPPP